MNFGGKTAVRGLLTVFDTWTPESSYFFGVLLADGTMRISKRRKEVRLRMKDRDVVESFAHFLGYPAERVRIEKSKTRYGKTNGVVYAVNCGNSHLVKKLAQLGMPIGSKSGQEYFPNIPKPLIHHFIRGFLDGDGSVGIYPSLDGVVYRVTFCSGSKSLLQEIKRHLPYDKGTIQTREYKSGRIGSIGAKRPKSNYLLQISTSQNKFNTIRNYLYRNAVTKMQRKHNVFFGVSC